MDTIKIELNRSEVLFLHKAIISYLIDLQSDVDMGDETGDSIVEKLNEKTDIPKKKK